MFNVVSTTSGYKELFNPGAPFTGLARTLLGLAGAAAATPGWGNAIVILVPVSGSVLRRSTPLIWVTIMRTSFMPYPRPSA